MFYGPYTKQEFYSDVLKEWTNPENKTHGDVVCSLLKGKYSWESLKSHYTKNPYIDAERGLYDYHCQFDGTAEIYRHADRDVARDILSRIGRSNPAMQNKVTGAIRAMRANGIHLSPKTNKPEVDFASLRSCK
tara:strand:+ start:403 stop:801 length:399 start_codon:yes stop_codon:yes gene_type:complete